MTAKWLSKEEIPLSNSRKAIVTIVREIARYPDHFFSNVKSLKTAVCPQLLDYGSHSLNDWIQQKIDATSGKKITPRFDTAFSWALQGMRHTQYIISKEKTQYVTEQVTELLEMSDYQISVLIADAWKAKNSRGQKWEKLTKEIKQALGISNDSGVYSGTEAAKVIWFRLYDLVEETIPHRIIMTAINNGAQHIKNVSLERRIANRNALFHFCMELCTMYDKGPHRISIASALIPLAAFKITKEEYLMAQIADHHSEYDEIFKEYENIQSLIQQLDLKIKPLLTLRNKHLGHSDSRHSDWNFPSWQTIFDFSLELVKSFKFISSFVFDTGHSTSFMETKPEYMKDYVMSWVNISNDEYLKYFYQVKAKMSAEISETHMLKNIAYDENTA